MIEDSVLLASAIVSAVAALIYALLIGRLRRNSEVGAAPIDRDFPKEIVD
jgi:hypothetical protein